MMFLRQLLLCLPAVAFVAQSHPRRTFITTARATTNSLSIEEASDILQQWDRNHPNDVGEDDAMRSSLPDAVTLLNDKATQERNQDSSTGRAILGICANDAEQGIATLKAWVTALNLPRGLLHGMDKDGIQLKMDGGVYIKYNSGGVFTFTEIRKAGLGFDAIWKPGDAMCEPYDGTYRGVYFQVELSDGEFRQYLVPLDIF